MRKNKDREDEGTDSLLLDASFSLYLRREHFLGVCSSDNPFGSLKIKDISCSEDECTELAFSTTLGGQRTFSYDHQCCYSEQCNTMSKRDGEYS